MKNVNFFIYSLLILSLAICRNVQVVEMKEGEETNIEVQNEEIILIKKIENNGYLFYRIKTSNSQNSLIQNIYNSTSNSVDDIPTYDKFNTIKNITQKVEGGEVIYSTTIYVNMTESKYSIIKIKGLKPNETIKVYCKFTSNFFAKMIIVGVLLFFVLVCCICCGCCCCCLCRNCFKAKSNEKIE